MRERSGKVSPMPKTINEGHSKWFCNIFQEMTTYKPVLQTKGKALSSFWALTQYASYSGPYQWR